MEIYQKYKKVFLFSGILVVLVLLYELFFSGSGATPKNSALNPARNSLVSELSVSPADAIVGRELLSALAKLQSISLDASIFADPVFASLKDKSLPIEPQPFGKALGRRNPFSDFGKGNGVANTSNASNLPGSRSGAGAKTAH